MGRRRTRRTRTRTQGVEEKYTRDELRDGGVEEEEMKEEEEEMEEEAYIDDGAMNERNGEVDEDEEEEEEEDDEEEYIGRSGGGGGSFFARRKRPRKRGISTVRSSKRGGSKTEASVQKQQQTQSAKERRESLRASLNLADDDAVRAALRTLPTKHFNERSTILRRAEAAFPRWKTELMTGLNVMLYGFGSKRDVLNAFAGSQLTDGAVIVVDGYSPRLASIKQVLTAAVESFYDEAHAGFASSSRDALMGTLQRLMARRGTPLYFVVHNMDAPALRSRDARAVFSQVRMNAYTCSDHHEYLRLRLPAPSSACRADVFVCM